MLKFNDSATFVASSVEPPKFSHCSRLIYNIKKKRILALNIDAALSNCGNIL
jgi:hypothetical protein